jgi:type I restriction enzyme S subunit
VLWLYYLLNLLNLNRFATGQAQPGLSVDVLEKVPVKIPSDEREQQRIATCLSSLDTLITAETQKLETLKTHKKGLMQQLFPSPGETLHELHHP